MKKTFVPLVLLCLFLVTACSVDQEEKLRDIEYTVATIEQLPQEVQEVIKEKKKENMQFTYETEEYLYVIKGYGAQATSGYSIQVKEFYLTQDHMVFSTILQGPREGQQVKEKETYPVIVVKTESLDKNVVFQ